uniref:Uncharacterized protein n=1 Tax=Takifugu rubripes TaxID=31033 RepID=A0A674PES5_TAKRU
MSLLAPHRISAARPNQTSPHRWSRKISVTCDLVLDLILGFKDRFIRSTQLTVLILISCLGTAHILLWFTLLVRKRIPHYCPQPAL